MLPSRTGKITSGLFVVLLGGCDGHRDSPGPDGQAHVNDSATSIDSDGSVTVDSTTSTDTAIDLPTGLPILGEDCRPELAGVNVRLCGDEAGDFAGRYLDAGDVDMDGVDELIVSAPHEQDLTEADIAHSSVHMVSSPLSSGYLAVVSHTTWLGTESSLAYWGRPAVLAPTAAQVALGGIRAGYASELVHVFDIPDAPGSVVLPEEQDGTIDGPAPLGELGLPNSFGSPCSASGPEGYCFSTIHSNDSDRDYAGSIVGYTAPIEAAAHVLGDAAFRVIGTPGDEARVVNGRGDLDGDGVNDLLIGAFFSNDGFGGAAAVMALAPGDYSLWDAASAAFVGVESNSEMGLAVASGELDGDGYLDAIVGAPFAGTGTVYAFRGPLTGEHSAADSDWVFEGDVDGDWFGYALETGDLDDSGRDDLVVGAPRSIYTGATPGTVEIYGDPDVGVYTVADAQAELLSGVPFPDAFGMALSVGRFDEDAVTDLAVGAPGDPTVGDYGGSVTIFLDVGL